MIEEIKKYSKIMYEKNFIYGLRGSISARYEDDFFIINKNIIYDENDRYYTKLALNENYKYKDASKDAVLHSMIYSNFSQAKTIAVVVSKDILKICHEANIVYANKEIFIQNKNILNDEEMLVYKLKDNNFTLISEFGLVIFARDFNELFAKIFEIDLIAKIIE